MSGRMGRVKNALASVVEKLKGEVEASQKNGKIPADYSLGFLNAAIFFDHQINMRSGEPKFYDRTTSVGSLPKPVALKSDKILGAEEIFENLRDMVILQARNFAAGGPIQEECKRAGSIVSAVNQLDKFIEQLGEIENDEKENEINQIQNGKEIPPQVVGKEHEPPAGSSLR